MKKSLFFSDLICCFRLCYTQHHLLERYFSAAVSWLFDEKAPFSIRKKKDLHSSDKIQEMIGLVNKRQGFVNFTVEGSYKDGKKYINLVSFEWV